MEFTLVESYSEIRQNEEIKNESLEIDLIFRYKFTEPFMEHLFEFSKIHQYDDRSSFKEAWTIWIKENEEFVLSETNRLLQLGYIGNIQEKMFKSARYYFRKKSVETKVPQQRRKYIGVTKDLLEAMDTHIHENITKQSYQPKDGFVDFCLHNKDILRDSVTKICAEQSTQVDAKAIETKMKKTYKNRYFRIINK